MTFTYIGNGVVEINDGQGFVSRENYLDVIANYSGSVDAAAITAEHDAWVLANPTPQE